MATACHDAGTAGQGPHVTRRPDEDRFRDLYTSNFNALLSYALRRVARPEDAADVVADTFLVAWRRRGHLPAGDDARLWLYGVARNMLANQRRGERRRDRLGERLRERLAGSAHLFVHEPDHLGVRAAMATLSDADREVLLLTAWEGLQPQEVARVLGISDASARQRVSRARRRLGVALGHESPAPGHVVAVRADLATEES